MTREPVKVLTFGMDRPGNNSSPSPASTPLIGSLRVSKSLIESVLPHPSRIRNVCILAHVDHGKTTLTDTLLASNGIISFKQAGKLRYLDSREDEQVRGITMEASAITLLFDAPVGPGQIERHVINLIDSPGHVDFSRQVVTAARLCDGCLVLVDAVEGVCTQTLAVLRQAKRERLTPCLVINKIDRLVTELKLSTSDAASRLFRLLEQVNAVQATIKSNEAFDYSDDLVADDEEDKDVTSFDPVKGNVIFASSTDGWAFTIEHFVQIFAKKMEIKPSSLRQTLWGESFFDSKTKKVFPKKAAHAMGLHKPMFAQFVLDSIWAIYECSVINWDEEKIKKISTQTGVNLPSKELRAKDSRGMLKGLLGQWLPLANTVFSAVISQTPSPLEANKIRLSSIVHNVTSLPEESKAVIDKIISPTSPSSEPMVAFLSKFLTVTVQSRGSPSRSSSVEDLSEALFLLNAAPEQNHEKLIGVCRMFHGSLAVGDKIYVLGAKHNPETNPDVKEHIVTELFLLMGRDVEPVNRVYAGNIFGIGGISEIVGKQATLTSTPACPLLEPPRGEIVPILQVAVRPSKLEHMSDVIAGLELLCQADPCAETHMQEENGEHILATAGELHLEQCLKDLREKYTKTGTDIVTSDPIIPYRETISQNKSCNEDTWRIHVGFDDTVREDIGLFTLTTMEGNCKISARALPIPKEILSFLLKHKTQMREAFCGKTINSDADIKIYSDLKELFQNSPSPWNEMDPSSIWAMAPRKEVSNLLLCSVHNSTTERKELSFFHPSNCLKPFESSILTGFQVITEKGPLCNEPLMGVAFVIEGFELVGTSEEKDEEIFSSQQSSISNQLISLSKTIFEAAFLFWSPRLMLAVYHCSIQTTAEMIGKVYSSLSKRRGRVISEDYHDGTGFFTVNSLLPVVESFGFADDIRGRTSGIAIPQLIFAGFEMLDEDPFWVPLTEDELEEHGKLREGYENVAMQYLVSIRERKGLFVERKLFQFAEKQRTLKK